MKNKLVKFFLIALSLALVLPTFAAGNVFAKSDSDVCTKKRIDHEDVWTYGNDRLGQDLCNSKYEGMTRSTVQKIESGTTSYEDAKKELEKQQEKERTCFDAHKVIGWIICPTIDATSSAFDWIMEKIEGLLTIDTQWYESGSTTEKVWSNILVIANTAMIIVLLVVIFSQVTGVGIDNYGIKKILPRLIVMAILINLSYFICQIAVDLSNILGAGLKDMLTSAVSEVDAKVSLSTVLMTIITTTLGGAGAVAGTAITITALATADLGPFLILALLAMILPALAAVILFFAMIALRSMIVIFCIVVSPLAFAAYILPNTQQLFKKWWNIFKATLIVYPLLGAAYGISKVMKATILSSSNGPIDPIMGMIAFVAPVLPFFMLPSLLKGSISALGSVGAAITGLGNKWRSGVSNTSKVAQEKLNVSKAAEAGRAKMDYDRAVKKHAELSQKAATGARLSVLQQQQLNDAQAKIEAYRKKEANALSGAPVLSEEYYRTTAGNAAVSTRATNTAGVAPIPQDIANLRAGNTRFAQETKMWSDQFGAQSPLAVQQSFIESLATGDSAKMVAAYNTLHTMKQFDKIYDVLDGKTSGVVNGQNYNISQFDWNSNQANILKDNMGTSSEVIFKTFSKTGHQANSVSFQSYMQGGVSTDENGNAKSQTLIEGIVNAKGLVNQDKATIKQLYTIQDQITGNDAGTLAKMVVDNLASKNNKPEDKAAFRGLIDKIGSDNADFASIFSNAINGAALAGMTMDDFNKIKQRVGNDESQALNIVAEAWRQATSSGNARLLAGMDMNLRAYLDQSGLPKGNSFNNNPNNNGPTPPPNSGPNNNNGGLNVPHI